jgi:SpoVK/Ycf46/Vps4 family AAA+-type ATPase
VQHRRLLAELLIQFNSISPDDKVVVLGATNRIEDVDEALLRRFHARICVGPPTHAARVALLKSFVATVEHDLSAKQFEAIAHATEGWSGADIEVLCREAALGPVRALFASEAPATECADPAPCRRADAVVAHVAGDQRAGNVHLSEATITSNVAEVKRPAAEVTPPRDSCSGRGDTATRKRLRVDALQLSKELAQEQEAVETVNGSLSPGDDDAPTLSATLLEELLNDGVAGRWRVPPVTYKDFLTAYATILSVDVAPQELADLITIPTA